MKATLLTTVLLLAATAASADPIDDRITRARTRTCSRRRGRDRGRRSYQQERRYTPWVKANSERALKDTD